MEGIVYHGSELDLSVLEPRKSTHQKNCVYATESKCIAYLFMGKGNGDLDTMIGTINDELVLVERREGVLNNLYNKPGYLYELDAKTFNHYDYLWSKEVISFEPVEINKKTFIPNILDAILEEEMKGNLKVYHYPDRPNTIPLDNSDLIEKYIKFERQGIEGAINELLKIYPEFKDKLPKYNAPLYFYHLVNKDANLENGLISLQYMYEHKMYDLFDKYASKYKMRILDDWDLEEFKGKENLTREETLKGLEAFRGIYGGSYIYFFRCPPFKELGPNMENILKYKDIYRIDINDPKVLENIADIFYGYDMSNSDNSILDKNYYENITEKDYFKFYDDNSEMNFAKLNHIGIAFKDGYCPKEFIKKVN